MTQNLLTCEKATLHFLRTWINFPGWADVFTEHLSMYRKQKQLLFEHFKTDILPTFLTYNTLFFKKIKKKEKKSASGNEEIKW